LHPLRHDVSWAISTANVFDVVVIGEASGVAIRDESTSVSRGGGFGVVVLVEDVVVTINISTEIVGRDATRQLLDGSSICHKADCC